MMLAPMTATAGDGTELVLTPRPDARSWLVLADGRPVGRVGLQTADRQAEIDVEIVPDQRGRGLASASVRAVSTWALDPDGADLSVLMWRAEVGNWAARRVAWSCGFRIEGQVRGFVEVDGWPRDGWIGTLTRDEPTRPLLPWYDPPRLELADLLLRANAASDAQRIAEACSDATTQHFLPMLPREYSLHDAAAFLTWQAEEQAVGAGINWAVASGGEPGALLGQIGLSGLRGGLSLSAEIGYWVHPQGRRQGLARAAVRAVARHALLPQQDGGLGLARVLVRVAASNTGSLQVAESAGLVRSGLDRRAERLGDGTLDDHVRFELIADELDEAWAHPSALR